ncbi:MAG: adenylate/guanylate cyclase domain-containing protein, partial [Candidatus Aminicenantes bacterium]|nr:adenylate/guanylate cyclase domain-containing protein [Candidatus Aminicenantes bacterium]
LDVFEEQQSLPWPWPREMYAYILQYLGAGGAKACVFDVIFSEVSAYGPTDDESFAAALANTDRAVLSLSLSKEKQGSEGPAPGLPPPGLDIPSLPPSAAHPLRSATLPVRSLLDAADAIGNVQFAPDGDGVYRRIPLFFTVNGCLLPALPLAAALEVTGLQPETLRKITLRLQNTHIPLDRNGEMIIGYHGPQTTYQAYSAAAVINSWAQMQEGVTPQIPPDRFAGKIVLIGHSAPGLLDVRTSPLDPACPGAVIQATALDNLLNGGAITAAAPLPAVLFLLAASLLAGLGASLHQSLIKISLGLIFSLVFVAAACAAAFYLKVWLPAAAPAGAVLLAFLSASLLNYSLEGRQRRFIKNVFRHYLSPHVIELIIKDPDRLRLGGEKREVTSFFSDVAGFTAISESLPPENLVDLLNFYLTEMTDIILAREGTLDKYEGDAIIAFWNAPLDQKDHALRACTAALDCLKRLEALQPQIRERCGHALNMRIGINSGPAVVGNMGSGTRFDYTAMGDTINLASRLEGASKQYKTSILIGETTHAQVSESIATREVDIIRVVGRKIPVRIYEILELIPSLSPEKEKRLSMYGAGLEAYRRRNWKDAMELFRTLPDDGPSVVYSERCRIFLTDPPPQDWDGVFDLKTK